MGIMKISGIVFLWIALVFVSSCTSESLDVQKGDISSSVSGGLRPIIIGQVKGVDPGSEIPISWNVSSSQPDKVAIEVSIDGVTWETIETSYPNSGEYNLAIPPVPGINMRVRVVPTPGSNEVIAISPGFSTDPPSEIKLADNNDTYQPGQSATITWEHQEYQPSELQLIYCGIGDKDTCKSPNNWVVLDNLVPNTAPEDGINSHTFNVPFTPGAKVIWQLVGDYQGTRVAYAEASAEIENIDVKNILIGSGSNLAPSSSTTLSWEHNMIQPSTMVLAYCVVVTANDEDCNSPKFDTSNPYWVVVSSTVGNSLPESGNINSINDIPVPYVPGASIRYALGAIINDTNFTFAQSAITGVKNDQAQVDGSFHSGGGTQRVVSGVVNQDPDKQAYVQISMEARLAPYIAPTRVKNAAPVSQSGITGYSSALHDRFQHIEIHTFEKGISN